MQAGMAVNVLAVSIELRIIKLSPKISPHRLAEFGL
jgi:hypothetical protein